MHIKILSSRGATREFYQTTVIPYGGTDCLIWPYGRNGSGYGTIFEDGKSRDVHRILCEEAHGAPPTPKHEAAHSCGNGNLGCVTKGHLSWKTHAENMADKILHGTSGRGEKSGNAKITELQAREILRLKGKETVKSLAQRFGITPASVSNLHAGRNWKWLTAAA